MRKINVLDCTLRDGGYCNQWRFGYDNIKKIIEGLMESNINIIECGFITNLVEYDSNVTKFTCIEQFAGIIPEERKENKFVAMLNYGEYDVDDLPEYNGKFIDGIRVAYHKKDVKEALELCKKIKEKGYLVFVQPMVSLSYSDEEFLAMIKQVNKFEPYAFYIVDSFGEMKKRDLIRLFHLVEHNLKTTIKIGFHSHNNLQLAYSNAQSLIDMHSQRDLLIDSSVYGMGRGAGNLNTELLVEYLNDIVGNKYKVNPLLVIIDEILNEFYQRNYWGYSLPNYLSAVHHLHPNYAECLDDKKTLTVENINSIFEMMDKNKKTTYDKEYIEQIYNKYMSIDKVHEERKVELSDRLRGKKVLLIMPGKSSVKEKEKIAKFATMDDVVTISVNFDYPYTKLDFIFLSNIRRYRELELSLRKKSIVTSNISTEEAYLRTKYQDLLIDDEAVKDNAGLMAIKFLSSFDIKSIHLAGVDGYAYDAEENYGDKSMTIIMKKSVLDAINKGMCRILKQFYSEIKIEFLTTPKYITFGE